VGVPAVAGEVAELDGTVEKLGDWSATTEEIGELCAGEGKRAGGAMTTGGIGREVGWGNS
jgi:hypothetical protein